MFGRTIIASLAALMLLMPLLGGGASAQRHDRRDGDWELLGSQKVGFGVDRDVIRVGRKEGRFEKIRLEVRDNDVEILDLKVFYNRGAPQDVRVRQFIRAGTGTRPIDLVGGDRVIERIAIVYKARPSFRGFAVVEVYGEKSNRPNWELLGEQNVGFLVDRDVIRVGRREGRFEKIALEVNDNDVEILDLKIFFNRGPPQDVRVRELIRAGGRTRPVDLVGGDRVIERIEIIYRSRPNFRGRAKVAIYGLQAGARGPGGPGPGPGGPGGPGGRWEELGCGNVGIKPDRDSIKVGRREGRFSAIQLRVSGNKVNILDLTVVYDRGPPDNLQVRSEIRDGGETRPLDLRGERRVIDRVELTYKIPLGVNLLKGPARVCVYGR